MHQALIRGGQRANEGAGQLPPWRSSTQKRKRLEAQVDPLQLVMRLHHKEDQAGSALCNRVYSKVMCRHSRPGSTFLLLP